MKTTGLTKDQIGVIKSSLKRDIAQQVQEITITQEIVDKFKGGKKKMSAQDKIIRLNGMVDEMKGILKTL